MYLLERLMLLIESLDESEADYKIAKYIYFNPKEVLESTLRKLADKVYVSPPSIVRFVNRLGISDYQTFKEHLALEWEHKKQKTLTFKENEFCEFIRNKKFDGVSSFLEFVKSVKKAKRIVFLGRSLYWQLFSSFFEQLRAEGKEVEFISMKTEKKKIDILEKLKDKDLVVLVFPEHDIYDAIVTLQRVEFDFVTQLEKKPCIKYCFCQSLSVYPGDYKVISLPVKVQEGLIQIEIVFIVNKLIELYKSL